MERQLFEILNFIAQKEFQLENIRQLLCEQVTFNLTDAFLHLSGGEDHSKITINTIQNLIGTEHNYIALQNVIKFYSNSNLNIDFSQFEQMIVTREDQLLAKLVRERQAAGSQFPQFIASYLKKLWAIQEQIHLFLANVRKKSSKKDLGTLLKFNKNERFDHQLLKNEISRQNQPKHEKSQAFCPHISVELALRYLKKNKVKCQLSFDELLYLFIPQNCNIVKGYLKEKEQNFKSQISKKTCSVSNPLIHKQYKKLRKYKQKSTESIPYSYRERISVENHISRNKKLPNSRTIKTKINQFSLFTQQKMLIFFKILKKVVKILTQIEHLKTECSQQHSSLLELYDEITKNDEMISSQLKNYFEKAGVLIQLNQCYAIFRKYANPLTGKMSRKQFLRIFRSNAASVSQTKKRVALTLQDRKQYLSILLKQIALQHKIQKQKLQFEENNIDLREVFSSIDVDQKSKISHTDLEVCFCQITKQKFSKPDLMLLWGRMGKKQLEQYLQYDLFMLEMLPRSVHRNTKIKHF